MVRPAFLPYQTVQSKVSIWTSWGLTLAFETFVSNFSNKDIFMSRILGSIVDYSLGQYFVTKISYLGFVYSFEKYEAGKRRN